MFFLRSVYVFLVCMHCHIILDWKLMEMVKFIVAARA